MAKSKVNYDVLADEIVKEVGGAENVTFFSHCITRLRFNVRDKEKISLDRIKALKGVVGSQWAGDQLQVVIGQTVADAYDAINHKYHLSGGAAETETPAGKKKTPKEMLAAVLDAVSGCVIPLIPMFVGGGMIKVLSMVLVLTGLTPSDGMTHYVLEFIGDAAFYFLPIAVAVMAAKKFETNIAIAVLLSGMLIHPSFITAVSEGMELSLFGIPITSASYASQVLPSILVVWVLSKLERLLRKVIPSYLRALGVPFLSTLIMAPVALWILAPLGYIIGNYLVTGLMTFANVTGFIGTGIIAALYPLLVLTGMHSILMPYFAQTFGEFGFEGLAGISIFIANFGQAAAALAVGLKSKDPDTKTTGISCFTTVVFAGVTEPALYGVNLPKKRPLIASLIGNFVGGCIGGIFAVKAYAFPGGSSVFAMPCFIGPNMSNLAFAFIAIIVGMVVTFILTWILGFEDAVAVPAAPEVKTNASSPAETKALPSRSVAAPLTGEVLPLEQVDDEIFATGVLGLGGAVLPSETKVYAPFDGSVTTVADTKHALGLISSDGVELLIHVGINTVGLNGKGFITHVQEEQTFKRGDLLMEFDLSVIKEAGLSPATMVIVSNTDDYEEVVLETSGSIKAGDQMITVR